jgi:death-on-curing protein
VIDAVHDMQIAEHGGAAGLRDTGMLDSALARPATLYSYGETDIFRLAAAYAFSLVRNHPFVDGNKRTAFLASYIFLWVNGHTVDADEASVATTMLALAAGDIAEDDFTDWLRANCKPA